MGRVEEYEELGSRSASGAGGRGRVSFCGHREPAAFSVVGWGGAMSGVQFQDDITSQDAPMSDPGALG